MQGRAQRKERVYDLEERLIRFAVRVLHIVDELPDTRAGKHIAGQLVRCGTSPAPNYGEAEDAESRDDFIHKAKVVLKELRETRVWLRMIREMEFLKPARLLPLLQENEELIKIFSSSVATAKRNRRTPTSLSTS
jgi:four helix bundle protein